MRRLRWCALGLVAGCAVTPLTNKIKVGEEAFVVVVGEGVDGGTDLFAAPAQGGVFVQLTFTRATEAHPALDQSGTRLAYTRQREPSDSSVEIVVMNLKTATEASGALPNEAGPVERVAWSPGGDTVIVATRRGIWETAAASSLALARETGPAAARLDSLSYPQIGDPVFATLRGCRSGQGLCVITPTGEETALDPEATDGIRWGGDALAYLVTGQVEVRPLGGGRVRQPAWTQTPAHLRQPTHYPGSPTR